MFVMAQLQSAVPLPKPGALKATYTHEDPLASGSEAQDKGDSRNHGFWQDPYVDMICWAPKRNERQLDGHPMEAPKTTGLDSFSSTARCATSWRFALQTWLCRPGASSLVGKHSVTTRLQAIVHYSCYDKQH